MGRKVLGLTRIIWSHRARAEQVKITLGEYSLNSDVEPLTPVKVGVSEIFIHPYFKFTPQADRYDVAVLRLDRYVPYEPHISPICLPEKDQDFLGEYAWAAGWGAMAAGLFPIQLDSEILPFCSFPFSFSFSLSLSPFLYLLLYLYLCLYLYLLF